MRECLRIAVIGSGPAGMYSVGHLLEEPGLDVEVDLYEQLPTPWGLVRSGVAPDHPEKKLIIDRLFNYYLYRPRLRFLGNVQVGSHVGHAELADWYHAVVYAVGAGNDVRMGIPGEELSGSWSAREFVAWYNGHPDYEHLPFDLSGERAVIVGNGNVALDVARILTSSASKLEKTDIADQALQALRKSNIREAVLLGRRGPMQGAFSNAELEELELLQDVHVSVEIEGLPGATDVVLDDADWATRRKAETLRRLASRDSNRNARSRIIFRFLSSPVEITGNGKVEHVRVLRNHLDRDEHGELRALPTKEEYLLDTGLVLRAIGYRGNPFPGLPFDDHKGIIPHSGGRVRGDTGTLPGVYVTGWIKRGPRGIIGTNKQCAKETVRHLLADFSAGKLATPAKRREQVLQLVRQRQPQLVEVEDWRRLDQIELAAGRAEKRPRKKLSSRPQLLAALARAASPCPE